MSDAISAALARAQAVVPVPLVQAAVPVTHTPQTTAAPRSLQDAMATAGTSVDAYIGLKEGSFTVGKVKLKVDEVRVTIRLSEVKFGYGVRYDAGGRQVYAKSYNGVTEARGRSWAEVVAQAQNMDPKCNGQYDLADIPMTLLEDVTVPAKPPTTISSGKRIGYTTSITGYAPFMAWVNEVMPKYGADAEIPVKLFKLDKTGGGYDYQVIGFETITN